MLEFIDPASAGMDPAGLAALDASVQLDIDEGRNFGANILVARGGKIVHRKAIGTVGPGRPAALDDIYFLMSMSKSFTAVLALRQIEQGLYSTDTLIDEVMPGFGVGGKEKATIGQLLCHTAGLPTALVPPPLPMQKSGQLAEVAAAVCKLKAIYVPGTRAVYTSGTGYDLLGQIVVNMDPQKRRFKQIAQDEIFGPLGMTDTSFGLAPDHPRRVKVSWTPKMVGPSSELTGPLFNQTINAQAEMPCGGALGTIDDIFRYTEALIGRAPNGVQLLKPETFAEARKNKTGDLTLDAEFVDSKLLMLRQMLGTVGIGKIFSVMRAARAAKGGEATILNHKVFPANFTYLGGYVRGAADALNAAGRTASPTSIAALGGASTSWMVDTERDLTFIFLSAGFIEGHAHMMRVERHADLAIAALKD